MFKKFSCCLCCSTSFHTLSETRARSALIGYFAGSVMNVQQLRDNPPNGVNCLKCCFILQLIDWEKTLASLQVDRDVGEPEWAMPGTKGGVAMLESFIDERLKLFATQRNDPNIAGLSQLSPWIRFGK